MDNLTIERTKEYIRENMPKLLKDDLVKIVMYGSCARGDYNDDSDVDIALLTRCGRMDAKKYDDKLMDVVTDVAMDIGTVVQYVCIPFDEYEDNKGWYSYFGNIEKDGVAIYG